MKTANYWNFSSSKGHNSVKNGSIVPKTEADLDILTINLYTKFHFRTMCNQCEENEWKLQIIGIFLSEHVDGFLCMNIPWQYIAIHIVRKTVVMCCNILQCASVVL
jgi:hypothetical protein